MPGTYTMVAKFKSDQYKTQIKKTVQITKNSANHINKHNIIYQRKLILKISALLLIMIIISIYYFKFHGSKGLEND
ncbi:hypothetical protein CG419_09135 [Latilactobacillus curvatus]|uniref:DUF3324 domain-containing protein n=1 Tax=Latilactobacillus curvatus TaxID=28038 RepID=A0AAC9Y1U6_LATCU|nr:hypothetical protein CG419_09135 [Latilactobacillus curvatus]